MSAPPVSGAAGNGAHASYQVPTRDRWSLQGNVPRAVAAPAQASSGSPSPLPWRALTGLVLVYAATVLGVNSLWAAVLLWWIFGDFKNRTTWFMETISRDGQPLTYWLLLFSWLGFSILLVFMDLGVVGGVR